MGINQSATNTFEAQSRTTPLDRLSSDGFSHIYANDKSHIVDVDFVEAKPITDDVLGRKDFCEPSINNFETKPLITVVQEQTTKLIELSSRLESASFRIGYLEALLSTKEEEIKLLPQLQMCVADAITQEKKAQELAIRIRDLEAQLTSIKSNWWCRFLTWFFGLKK